MSRTQQQLPSVLEQHFEELQTLWERRRFAVRDPEYNSTDLAELDQRIEAHTDGLVISAEHTQSLLEEGLGAGEVSTVFAAAYVMLRRCDQTAADQVVDGLLQAEDEALDGFLDALCHGPIELIASRLQETLATAPAAAAVVAAEALAYHRKINAESGRLDSFFQDEDPRVRRSAWCMASLLDG